MNVHARASNGGNQAVTVIQRPNIKMHALRQNSSQALIDCI